MERKTRTLKSFSKLIKLLINVMIVRFEFVILRKIIKKKISTPYTLHARRTVD